MSCPTCDHTLAQLCESCGSRFLHCSRCGTVQHVGIDGGTATYVPKLVERCRDFGASITGVCAEHLYQWKSLGIAESINPPGRR